jgi:Eukaryotic initiation factor 4E
VYHAVGENFPHSTEVVGIALNLRKTGARLAVWIRGTLDLEGTKAIGRDFRKVVHLPASKHVGFSQHADIKLKKQFYWSSFKGDLQV